MKAIPKLSEIKGEPIVGKYYLVPCVETQYYGQVRPVIGNEHEDAEYIGFPKMHWHFDLRFLSDKTIEEMEMFSTRDLSCFEPESAAMVRIETEAKFIGEKRMKCLRKMPVFPIECKGELKAKYMPELEEAYKDKNLSKCLTCPHRGIKVSAELADGNGVSVCPGHGLAWNVKTGEMVRRLKVTP